MIPWKLYDISIILFDVFDTIREGIPKIKQMRIEVKHIQTKASKQFYSSHLYLVMFGLSNCGNVIMI